MISAVLDTNILASGTVTTSTPPGQILNAWRDNQFELVVSTHIIDELKRTFQKPYFQKNLTPQAVNNFFNLLENETTITPITAKVQEISTHPEDDLILATAVSAEADYLVTGDQPLLQQVGSSYQGVKIVTPNDFIEILQKQNKVSSFDKNH